MRKKQTPTNFVTQQQLTLLRTGKGIGHTHPNKDVLDQITAEMLAFWHYDAENKVVFLGDEENPVSLAAYGEVSAGGVGGDTPTPGTIFTSIAYANLAALTSEEMDKIPTAWAAKQLLTRVDALERKDSALYLLSDTYHNTQTILRADGTAKRNGDGLVYNASLGKWVAAAQAQGGVTSVINLTGAITRTQLINALALTANDIPSLPAGKITSGTFGAARIPDLSASKITSGTFDSGRIPTLAISKISGLQDALDGKVPTTRTVNGHPLSANVTVTKSDIGLGNVENKSSATIRGEITSANVTNALGFTPVNKAGDTMTGDLIANTTSINLGTSAKPWGRIYANRWYPNENDTTNYIEYTNGGFLVHGNIAATGEVAAGA